MIETPPHFEHVATLLYGILIQDK